MRSHLWCTGNISFRTRLDSSFTGIFFIVSCLCTFSFGGITLCVMWYMFSHNYYHLFEVLDLLFKSLILKFIKINGLPGIVQLDMSNSVMSVTGSKSMHFPTNSLSSVWEAFHLKKSVILQHVLWKLKWLKNKYYCILIKTTTKKKLHQG